MLVGENSQSKTGANATAFRSVSEHWLKAWHPPL